MIEVRVLGPLEVTVDGAAVRVGGPRQRCVLARLVAARGQLVSADRIIEDLYAGDPPPGAQAAVQSYVSRLRRVLEPERRAWGQASVLVAAPPGYALRLGDGAVDAWVFEEAVRAQPDDPAAAHARLSAALAAWRGPAFAEFAGQPWADLEASRLAGLRVTAAEARAGAALRLGWAAQVVPDAERLTAEHPLREEGWRLLALARYQAGQQGDALAALRRARELLAAELGIDPGPALRDLEEQILRQERVLLTATAQTSPLTRPGADVGELRVGVDRLHAPVRKILQQAAVIGDEADTGLLGELAGLGEADLLDAVDAAVDSGLVSEPAPGRIRFADATVRDALYDSLSQLRRARLHDQVAAALARREPADVAALAHHLTAAGTDPVRAARYCGLAADEAERRLDFPAAARLREQALGLLDQVSAADWAGPEAAERLELVLGLVRALAADGQLTAARTLRHQAVRAAGRHGETELLARVVTALDVPRPLFFLEPGGTDHEVVRVTERLLAELPPGDTPLRGRLLITLASELADGGTERGAQAAAEAVALAGRLGDPDLRTLALVSRWAESYHGDGPAERLRIGGELLTVSGRPATAEALARAMLMAASAGVADFRAADWHASEAARVAARHRLPMIEAAVFLYRAMRAALNGDPAAAADRYRDASRQLSRFGLRAHGAAVAAVGQAALLITQDRTAEIVADLDLAGLFPELYALGLAAAGQVDEARLVAGPLAPVRRDRGWLFLTTVRGLLAVATGDRPRAAAAYQALLPHAGEPAGAESLLITLWPVAQVLGDLARYLGRPGADAHYQHALAIAERAGVPSWRAAAARGLGSG